MIKGEKVRLDVHNILYSIYKFNRTLNNPKILKIIDKSKAEDIPFINNVTLNSMRLHFHTLKIAQKYVKKKLRINEKILLISAISVNGFVPHFARQSTYRMNTARMRLESEKIEAFKEGMPNRGGDEKHEDKRVVMKFGGSSLADAERVSKGWGRGDEIE